MFRFGSLTIALALVYSSASAANAATPGHTGYYTYHFDNNRTGWNPDETALTQASVASGKFGLVRTLAADSVVYAQPLYVPNVVAGGASHNLAIIATENDSVYAYDADDGALVWSRSFVSPAQGITAVSIASVGGCGQITPTIGISSTPVVDPSTNTLYVVDKIQVTTKGATTYHNQLHALALSTGADRIAPAEIAGSVKIVGGGTDVFTDQWEQNRVGLLLLGGMVYVGFGSSCDENQPVTHGWMFAYNKLTLKNAALFNTTTTKATDYLGSIWQSTYAPAADTYGSIYLAIANGVFDANVGGTDYGESVLKLSGALTVQDYFAPYNELALSNADEDIGSTGVMLVPLTSPRLAVSGNKSGTMYLLNRSRLGEYHAGSDDVLQKIQLESSGGALFGGPAYYPGFIYWGASDQPMEAFALSTSPTAHLTLASETTNSFTGEGGEIPGVSSNGTTPGTAIVWATTRAAHGSKITLWAYNATNLKTALFSGTVGIWEAQAGAFLTPTIADGHVFVGGAGYGVAEFGLK